MKRGIVLGVVAALVVVPSAAAANGSDISTFVAGHETQVACDATLGGHAGGTSIGWTAYGGSTVYLVPSVCDGMRAPVGSEAFARAIGTVIHESAHARGIRTETCAEMTADVGVFDILRRFYGVPFFTPRSRHVGAQVLAFTRRLPAEYQPEACFRDGYR